MDKEFWERRDAIAKHNLLMYAQQLMRGIIADDPAITETAITGINMASTMRKICAYEIAALTPDTPESVLFGKGRDQW
jgi:hypothetical protein